jgi:hypothetical protein
MQNSMFAPLAVDFVFRLVEAHGLRGILAPCAAEVSRLKSTAPLPKPRKSGSQITSMCAITLCVSQAPERRLPRVIQSIRELAQEIGAGGKLPTLNQWTERLNVSRATVVRALEDLEQQGVLVRRHGSGIYAANDLGRVKILALLNSNLLADVSPLWGLLLGELLKAGADGPEDLVFEFTSPNRHGGPGDSLESVSPHVWRDIRGHRFSAAIIIGADSEVAWAIEAAGLRTTAFAAPGFYVVQISPAEVCQLGCQELARRGCRRVAVLGANDPGVLEFADVVLRQSGCRLVSARPGGGGKPTVSVSDNRFELAQRAFQDAVSIFQTKDPERCPDGVVLLDDMYTQGFLHGLAASGREVGKDVWVATHSNAGSPALVGFEDRIVRLEYDPKRIVETLLYAARCVVRGVNPTECGWDSAVVVEGRTAEIEILTLRAKLILPSKVC